MLGTQYCAKGQKGRYLCDFELLVHAAGSGGSAKCGQVLTGADPVFRGPRDLRLPFHHPQHQDGSLLC